MSEIERAAAIIRAGGLVAFPTETVYGLGADATDASAVRKLFAAKGRPSTNPVIVHVAHAQVARRFAANWPELANRLAERFWPGPLTLVLPKKAIIVDEVSAGLDTIGLRAPDHPVALALLRAMDGALAGPSANRSTRVSPTTAEHVRAELGDAVDLVLDGGPCRVGIESTVLDLSTEHPAILRPGAVTRAEIEALIGPVEVRSDAGAADGAARSPGQQAIHYSPRTPAYRYAVEKPPALGAGAAIVLSIRPLDLPSPHRVIRMPSDPLAYGTRLYAAMREADASGVSSIHIELPPDKPAWHAVRDRLFRATRATD